jgi:protein TonB
MTDISIILQARRGLDIDLRPAIAVSLVLHVVGLTGIYLRSHLLPEEPPLKNVRFISARTVSGIPGLRPGPRQPAAAPKPTAEPPLPPKPQPAPDKPAAQVFEKKSEQPIPEKKKPKRAADQPPSAARPPEQPEKFRELRSESSKIQAPVPGTGSASSGAAAGSLALLGEGGGVLFGGEGWDFPWYGNDVMNALSSHWVAGIAAPYERGLSVTVRFVILRDGTIVKPEIYESSGVARLDDGALRAVINSNPLPPLPKEFKSNSVEVVAKFPY